MSRNEIFNKLAEIFKTIFDDDTLQLKSETCRNDIDEWDSLSQLRLILSVEKNFHIKLKPETSILISSFGEFVDAVEQAFK